MLKESEETLFHRPLKTTRAERLIVIKDGCDKVLTDLQSLVDKYGSLGTQSKRTWDRMKWGNEDIAEIRARLISSTIMLNAFISTSESNVESKLDNFIKEYRQGRREASIISLQTVDSLSADDKALWRTIRKELEEIGITVAAFDANRNFIFDWFIRAAETGAFEEQGERGSDDESDFSEEQASRSNNERVKEDAGQETRHTKYESLTNIREEQPFAPPYLSVDAAVAEPHSQRGPKTSGEIVASTRVFKSTHVSQIAAFVAVLSRPGPRLLEAVDARHFAKALKILKFEASLMRLDQKTLNEILLRTTMHKGLDFSDHLSLVSKLIARGANVNYVSSDSGRTPLWNSVAQKSIAITRLLIENGADVNYFRSNRGLGVADNHFAPRLALTKDSEILRLLLSAGLDTAVRYWICGTGKTQEWFFEVSLIHEAAHLGAISAIETLLEHGADVDLPSLSGGTALMVALLEGKANVAKLLLARGANPEFEAVKTDVTYSRVGFPFRPKVSYKRPIEAAIVGGDESMVSLLLERGVLPTSSTLHYAKEVKSCLRYRPRGPSATFVAPSIGVPDSKREDREVIHVLEQASADRMVQLEEANQG